MGLWGFYGVLKQRYDVILETPVEATGSYVSIPPASPITLNAVMNNDAANE